MRNQQNKVPFRLKVLPTQKFKTTTITLKFMAPLDSQTITSRTLLSKMLVRATKRWPTDKAFNRHLSQLYGAHIHSFVSKFKDQHVITLSLEIVNERYLKDDTPLIEKGFQLLKEIIWNPLVSSEQFDAQFLTQEKSLLKKKLESVVDNKSQYAFLQLLKNMFGDQAYSEFASGRLADVDQVTPASLYETYQSMLHNDFSAVYVVGNVEEADIEKQVAEYFDLSKHSLDTTPIESRVQAAEELPKEIVETDEVDQAKLNLGFKLPTRFGEQDYFALIVFNMMFGGDPSSVLFNEVREKQSLAYSIHSQVDAKNGYMFVLSGVTADKYQQAKDTILHEFTRFQQGEFTQAQLALAKKVLISQRLEAQDRPKSIIEILNNNVLLEEDLTHDVFAHQVQAVTKDDVVQLAQNTQVETIYTLTKREEDEA